jgi:hypothetical protein
MSTTAGRVATPGAIYSRRLFINAEQPPGHYAELHGQLDAYADELANDITVVKFTLMHSSQPPTTTVATVRQLWRPVTA